MAGGGGERGAVGGDGLRRLSRLVQRGAEGVEQGGVAGAHGARFLEQRGGPGEAPGREQPGGLGLHGGGGGLGAVEQAAGGGEVRLQQQRLPQRGGGGGPVPHGGQDAPGGGQGLGRAVPGDGADGPVPGLLELPGLGQQQAEQAHGNGVIAAHGLAAGGDGGPGAAGAVEAQGLGQGGLCVHPRRLHAGGRWLEGRRAALAVVLVLAGAAGAQAQEDPKVALEDIPLGLDPLPGFADPGAAQRRCPGDAVVWPDPATGYFHPPRSSRFAAAQGGFACLGDALGAGYWDANPFAGGPARNRAFPIDPALRPNPGS